MKSIQQASAIRRLCASGLALALAVPVWTAGPVPAVQAADPISNPQPRSNVLAPG